MRLVKGAANAGAADSSTAQGAAGGNLHALARTLRVAQQSANCRDQTPLGRRLFAPARAPRISASPHAPHQRQSADPVGLPGRCCALAPHRGGRSIQAKVLHSLPPSLAGALRWGRGAAGAGSKPDLPP